VVRLLAGGVLLPLIALVVLGLTASDYVRADSRQDSRADAGARSFFRMVLGYDVDLDKKRTPQGALLVVFFHNDDPKRARQLADSFAARKGGEPQPVKSLPLVIELCTDPTFAAYAERTPAAVFVAQDVDGRTLKKVVEFGVAHHVITFSPFEGHVESGVLAGLFVDAQLKPFLNRRTMAAGGVALSPTLLKYSRLYE